MREPSLLLVGLQGLFAVLCTLAIALAIGAVWMAVTLRIPSAAWWFALPAGLAMGYATRAWVTSSRTFAMVLAAAGTWLAAIYMQCLFTGLKLAAVMGLGYLTVLRKAGLCMLLALARASWDARLLMACLVGMLLALAMAGRKSSKVPVSHRPAP